MKKSTFFALCTGIAAFWLLAGGGGYASSLPDTGESVTDLAIIETEETVTETEETATETEDTVAETGETAEPDPLDGFVSEGQATYYYENGSMVVNSEKYLNNEWYFFGPDGKMAVGWTQHHGNQYYYNEQGHMAHGVTKIEGTYYGFNEWTGVLLAGEHFFTDGRDDQWYYFYEKNDTSGHKKGQMAVGWTQHHGNTYYYNDKGQMVHKIYKVGDKYYGFNEWTGVLLSGECYMDDAWRYFDENGVMAIGWTNHHGHRYYYNQDGSMYYGELYLNDQWYYFDEITGVMATGWTDHHNNHYFYRNDGTMVHGELYLGEQWYYFDQWTGVMATGWTSHSGNTYYYDDNGRMAHGRYKVGGVEYYFDEWTGVLKTGWRYENGYKVFYNSDGTLCQNVDAIIGRQSSYFIKVNTATNTVTVFAKDGKNGYIIPVKKMICSTGLPGTPTVKGTFTVRRLGNWVRLMGNVYGQYVSQIYNDYLFHSAWFYVSGNRRSLSVSEYRKLGNNASHGCVRLTVGDAKWIYDNCNGSTVYIYSGADTDPLYKPARPNPVVIRGDWGYDPTDPGI